MEADVKKLKLALELIREGLENADRQSDSLELRLINATCQMIRVENLLESMQHDLRSIVDEAKRRAERKLRARSIDESAITSVIDSIDNINVWEIINE
jgi:hypothetical protein